MELLLRLGLITSTAVLFLQSDVVVVAASNHVRSGTPGDNDVVLEQSLRLATDLPLILAGRHYQHSNDGGLLILGDTEEKDLADHDRHKNASKQQQDDAGLRRQQEQRHADDAPHLDRRELQDQASVELYLVDDDRIDDVAFRNAVKGSTGDGYFACGLKITGDSFHASSLEITMCSASNWGDQYTIFDGVVGQFASPVRMCPPTTYVTGGQVTTRDLLRKSDNGFLPHFISTIALECRPTDGSSFQETIELTAAPFPFPPLPDSGENEEYKWSAITRNMKSLPVDIGVGRRYMRGFKIGIFNDDLAGLELVGEFMPSYSSAEIRGRWESVQRGQDISYQLEIKYTKTDGTTMSQTDSYAFTLGVTAGYSFDFGGGVGASASISVSETATSTATEAVQETFSLTQGEKFTFNCRGETPTGVWELWRWSMGQEGDSDGPGFEAKSKYTRCTYGQPPRCPLGYCDPTDAQCQTCIEPFADLSDDDSCERGGLFSALRCK